MKPKSEVYKLEKKIYKALKSIDDVRLQNGIPGDIDGMNMSFQEDNEMIEDADKNGKGDLLKVNSEEEEKRRKSIEMKNQINEQDFDSVVNQNEEEKMNRNDQGYIDKKISENIDLNIDQENGDDINPEKTFGRNTFKVNMNKSLQDLTDLQLNPERKNADLPEKVSKEDQQLFDIKSNPKTFE